MLAIVGIGVLLAMAPWFSSSAVAPLLTAEWGLDRLGLLALTIAVQLGFAAGALLLAVTAAAICTYLADEFPRAKLNIPVGDRRRGVYLKWLFFGPSCLEPAMMDRAFPRKEEARRAALGYGDFDTVMSVAAKAVAQGPYIMGERFTAADVVIGSALRFGMMFKLLPERPEFTAYVGRLAVRPALQRVDAQDKELAAA